MAQEAGSGQGAPKCMPAMSAWPTPSCYKWKFAVSSSISIPSFEATFMGRLADPSCQNGKTVGEQVCFLEG